MLPTSFLKVAGRHSDSERVGEQRLSVLHAFLSVNCMETNANKFKPGVTNALRVCIVSRRCSSTPLQPARRMSASINPLTSRPYSQRYYSILEVRKRRCPSSILDRHVSARTVCIQSRPPCMHVLCALTRTCARTILHFAAGSQEASCVGAAR